MRIVAVKLLSEFWNEPVNRDSEMPLRIWIEKTERASWTNFAEVKQTFGSADQVGNNRVIFNVGGNKFRLVAAIGYKTGFVLLKFVGTHKQYDRIDPEVIEVKDWK